MHKGRGLISVEFFDREIFKVEFLFGLGKVPNLDRLDFELARIILDVVARKSDSGKILSTRNEVSWLLLFLPIESKGIFEVERMWLLQKLLNNSHSKNGTGKNSGKTFRKSS